MRITAIILVIIGALLSVGLGAKWLSDYNQYKDQIKAAAQISSSLSADKDTASASKEVDESIKAVDKLRLCGIFLIICGILSVVAVFLPFRLKKISSAALVVLGIVPAVFSPVAFIVTAFGILGGIFLFFAKPKAA